MISTSEERERERERTREGFLDGKIAIGRRRAYEGRSDRWASTKVREKRGLKCPTAEIGGHWRRKREELCCVDLAGSFFFLCDGERLYFVRYQKRP